MKASLIALILVSNLGIGEARAESCEWPSLPLMYTIEGSGLHHGWTDYSRRSGPNAIPAGEVELGATWFIQDQRIGPAGMARARCQGSEVCPHHCNVFRNEALRLGAGGQFWNQMSCQGATDVAQCRAHFRDISRSTFP